VNYGIDITRSGSFLGLVASSSLRSHRKWQNK